MIRIADLNKATVLAALYNNAALPPEHINPSPHTHPMTADEAQQHLARNAGFDYLEDRLLKVHLGAETFDPWGYDRDNGAGLAQRVVDNLRATGSIANIAER